MEGELGKYNGRKGLTNAQEALKRTHKKLGRQPTVYDEGMSDIRWVIYRGVWREYRIKHWYEIIEKTFGKFDKKPKKHYTSKGGFKRAQNEARQLVKVLGRIPKKRDRGMQGICTAISRGKFQKENIRSWNEFIKITFNTDVKMKKPPNYYKGEIGLKKVQEELRRLSEIQKKIKTCKDVFNANLGGIVNAASKGYWKYQNVASWPDLIECTFGSVKYRHKQYRNYEGLELARRKLKLFEEKTGK